MGIEAAILILSIPVTVVAVLQIIDRYKGH